MKLRISDVRAMAKSILLAEGLKDDLKKKYGKDQPEAEQVIEKLAKLVKSKYLPWATKQVLNDKQPAEEVVSLLKTFEKVSPRLKNRDIFSYKTLGELRDAIEKTSTGKSQAIKLAKADADRLGTITTESDDELQIIVPKSEQAAIAYGAGTRWCISATQSKNYYQSYSSEDIIFYFVFNTSAPSSDPMHKVAFAVYRDEGQFSRLEIYDATDRLIGLDVCRQSWGNNVVAQLENIIERDANQRETTVEARVKKERDPQKIDAIISSGENLDLLIKNPNLSEEQIISIIRSKKVKDDDFSESQAFERIENPERVLNALLDARYFAALTRVLDWRLSTDRKEHPFSDELFQKLMWIPGLSEELAGWSGLTPEQEDALVDIGDDWVTRILLVNSSPEKTRDLVDRHRETLLTEPDVDVAAGLFYAAIKLRDAQLVVTAWEHMHNSDRSDALGVVMHQIDKGQIDPAWFATTGIKFERRVMGALKNIPMFVQHGLVS